MKYKTNYSLILFLVVIGVTYGQVQKINRLQIGNTSNNSQNSSAVLQMDETDRGFLPPRMTTAQRDAISSPAKGLIIYNTTTNFLEWYTGQEWYLSGKNPSSGGSSVVSSYSNNTSIGTITQGTALTDVSQIINADVATAGTYSIETTTINGIKFSGSGNFLVTGLQTIILTASTTATPTTNGTQLNFTLKTTPNCSFTRKISPQINIAVTIPSTITLNQSSNYLVPSCYDENYLPFVAPTTLASTITMDADGTKEDTKIDVAGNISTTGVVVKIPVTVTASGTLPAYSTTVTIPSSATEDGIGRDLTLSWAEQTYTYNSDKALTTQIITATINSVGGPLYVKKLDINSGIGSNYLGVLIGSFTYPYNSSGTTTTLNVSAIPLIPDRMAGVVDNAKEVNSHMMFYAPIVAEDGKIWLNNNLGADYSNINKIGVFNPIQQAVSATDYKAYGSFFQWGRKADGHELINWTETSVAAVNTVTTTIPSDNPNHFNFIISNTTPYYDWRATQNNNLWASESSSNNPCPIGFRVPTKNDFFLLVDKAVIVNANASANSILKFTIPGHRYYGDGKFYNRGSTYYLHTSEAQDTSAYSRYFDNVSQTFALSSYTSTPKKTMGCSVRCIKN
jgi:uncharacterized protein (TIGR02145 family)